MTAGTILLEIRSVAGSTCNSVISFTLPVVCFWWCQQFRWMWLLLVQSQLEAHLVTPHTPTSGPSKQQKCNQLDSHHQLTQDYHQPHLHTCTPGAFCRSYIQAQNCCPNLAIVNHKCKWQVLCDIIVHHHCMAS